jgi:hypothetical protein
LSLSPNGKDRPEADGEEKDCMSPYQASLLSMLTLLAVHWPVHADATASFVLPSGVAVTITEAPFDRSQFKIVGCSETDSECLVNGVFPVGSAGLLPSTYVKSIVITFDGKSHSLDVSNMYNAWGSRPLEVEGVIRYFGGRCDDQDNCQVRGLFSDAAGSFVAEWCIASGVPVRTVLTDTNDVVNLFMKNIDPPEYE